MPRMRSIPEAEAEAASDGTREFMQRIRRVNRRPMPTRYDCPAKACRFARSDGRKGH